jgi:hypothetical protein
MTTTISTLKRCSVRTLSPFVRVLFMLFVCVAYSGVQHVLTAYMSNMAGV